VGKDGVLVHNACYELVKKKLGSSFFEPRASRRRLINDNRHWYAIDDVLDKNGRFVTIKFDKNGFPDFDGFDLKGGYRFYSKQLSVTGNRSPDFKLANNYLLENFSSDDINIPNGNIESGWFLKKENGKFEKYTWHHHQDGKTLIPVRQRIHNNTPHTGGVAINEHGLKGSFSQPEW